MKVLVVGLNPSRRSPNKKVLKNSTLERLNKWMDFFGIINFSFINSYDTIDKSDIDIKRLGIASESYSKVIALGNAVSNSLSKAGVNHFKMPHPSPLNRKLNDKQYEADILIRCKHYLEENI